MKTIALALSMLIAGTAVSFAQCEKKLLLNSSKTEHLNATGELQRTDDETAVIELTKTDLNVSINGGEHKISGKIKSETCDWKVPFKEGKTVIKAMVTDEQGEDKNVTITIEGKDGKVTLLFELEGMPDDRIRVWIDKFVEKTA